MSLLLCCGQFQASTTDWNPIINALPSLCRGIIFLLAFIFLLKYVFAPLISNWHEIKVKVKNEELEEKWDTFKKTERDKGTINELNEQITTLKKDIKTYQVEKEMLEKRLSIYEETFNKLNTEIKPKS